MADIEVTIPFVDGASQTRNQESLQTLAGAVVPETALRANSAPVSSSNPLPVNSSHSASVYGPPLATTITNASPATTLATPGQYSKLTIQTLANQPGNIWLSCDGATIPARNTGLVVFAGGDKITFGSDAFPMPVSTIVAITDASGPVSVMIQGVT